MLFNRKNISVLIAVLFHACGAVGMLYGQHADWFIKNTALNLLLMFVLLLWNQSEKNLAFYAFIIIAYLVSMGVEMIGVNTGHLFGEYQYGTVMGPKLNGVPFLIGINWLVLIFSSGVLMHKFHVWLRVKTDDAELMMSPLIEKLSFIFDGALLAVFFDWLMEPVAIKLGFWHWKNGVIPDFNYICWFGTSMVLLFVFDRLSFNRKNDFAIDLLLIQALFFLALRIFL